nr:MAG TPA: hypothetical protein [Caudoviricetes sp.]
MNLIRPAHRHVNTTRHVYTAYIRSSKKQDKMI